MKRTTTLAACIVTVIVVFAALPAAFAGRHATNGTSQNCRRNQLGVRLDSTQGAAGTIHGAWVFTNLSDTPCTLSGYPALQLYGRAGRPLPTTVTRDLSPGPTQVALIPGASATFFSSYSDVSSGEPCPVSSVVEITAPNNMASLFIPSALWPCGGVVHVSAVKAGVHHA